MKTKIIEYIHKATRTIFFKVETNQRHHYMYYTATVGIDSNNIRNKIRVTKQKYEDKMSMAKNMGNDIFIKNL